MTQKGPAGPGPKQTGTMQKTPTPGKDTPRATPKPGSGLDKKKK